MPPRSPSLVSLPVRPSRSPRVSLVGLAAISLCVSLCSASPDPAPWRDALAFDYNGASRQLAKLHAGDPGDVRVAIAHASALLALQPRTQANVNKAHALLSGIAARAPSTPDTVAAEYLLARIAQDHASPRRLDEARARYTRLAADHPDHPLAAHAAVKLALLLAYDTSGLTTEARVVGIQSLLEHAQQPSALRELHFILARLHIDASANARALPHLIAGRAIGYEQLHRNANIDLTIGNLAASTGDRATAIAHYRAFAEASPRDPRTSTVRRLIATLVATPAVPQP